MSNSSFFDIKFYLATFFTEINFYKKYINKLLKYDICFYLQKYNMFVAQMGCAAIGVLAFSIFGPGWLARSTALAAAIAFMIFTRSVHPPGNYFTFILSTNQFHSLLSTFKIHANFSHDLQLQACHYFSSMESSCTI